MPREIYMALLLGRGQCASAALFSTFYVTVCAASCTNNTRLNMAALLVIVLGSRIGQFSDL